MAYKFDNGWEAADRFVSVDPVEVSAINEDERPTDGECVRWRGVCVGRYDFELLGHDTPFGPEARYKMGELAE